MTCQIRRIVSAAAVAVLLMLADSALASVTYTWIGTGSGDWSNSANWSGGILPVSDKDSVLLFSGTSTAPFVANNDLPSPFQMYVLTSVRPRPAFSSAGGRFNWLRRRCRPLRPIRLILISPEIPGRAR